MAPAPLPQPAQLSYAIRDRSALRVASNALAAQILSIRRVVSNLRDKAVRIAHGCRGRPASVKWPLWAKGQTTAKFSRWLLAWPGASTVARLPVGRSGLDKAGSLARLSPASASRLPQLILRWAGRKSAVVRSRRTSGAALL